MTLVELTEFMVRELLPTTEEITVKEVSTDGDHVIQVLVPNEYMSTVIGKGGKIANSIRTIVQAAAYVQKTGKVRVNIDTL